MRTCGLSKSRVVDTKSEGGVVLCVAVGVLVHGVLWCVLTALIFV